MITLDGGNATALSVVSPLFTIPHQATCSVFPISSLSDRLPRRPEGPLQGISAERTLGTAQLLQSSAVSFWNRVVVYPLSNNPRGNTSQMTSLNSFPPPAEARGTTRGDGRPTRRAGYRSSAVRKGRHRSGEPGRRPQVFTGVLFCSKHWEQISVESPHKSHTNHFLI